MTRIENISEEDWNFTIDTNLKGVFLCNRAVASYLSDRRKGRSSIFPLLGTERCRLASSLFASKAGVIVLSQRRNSVGAYT